MKDKKRILVVGTHPDDESIGAGGSICRFTEEGHELFWLIMTNIDEKNGFPPEFVARRQNEITSVASFFGFKDVAKLDYPTTKLCNIPQGEIIQAVSNVFMQFKPDHVILPFFGDIHGDHRITFECTYACTKSFRYPFIKTIWMMETISETDFSLPGSHNAFVPNVFVDVSKTIEKKIEATMIYESEMGHHPFPRSAENIKALAHFRGATAGVHYAESFVNIKTIL